MRVIIFLSLWVCFTFQSKGQAIDSIACKKVEDTLQILKDFVKDINSDPHLNRIGAVAFFQSVANIPYDGKVSFIGTEFPSNDFYLKCRNWYVSNVKRLRWDNVMKQIVLSGK